MIIALLKRTFIDAPPTTFATDANNLGRLLLQFLLVYGEFDYQRTGISITDVNRRFFLPLPTAQTHVTTSGSTHIVSPSLYIEDPLMPGNNVGTHAFCMWRVKQMFEQVHKVLTDSSSPFIYTSASTLLSRVLTLR
eukprot:TRINITY_DN5801_c1_g1_i3.p1 TRINITY_DN5801_c1_g1~~TRINITY_DN5801_c1_g1_i3.p1  ORF type:complete len:136 (-),score=39.77 TRINITY_DN5801_c1_g1_i3:34-441(-)